MRFFGVSVAAVAERWMPMIKPWLSAPERTRAERFHREADRQRFLLGRGLLRALMAEHLGVEPGSVVFTETATGRPLVAGSGLDFNLAHSGDSVLIAWSTEGAVGADVEAMASRTDESLAGIAELSFSLEECAVLKGAAVSQKAAVFHRIWVRKEAVIKAEGVGMGGPLREFSVVRLGASGAQWNERVPYPGSARSWRLVDLVAPEGSFAALAVSPEAEVTEGSAPSRFATVAS